ncbi:MAG: DegT/DnrJ/EryC1/StrS family aminotransferase, partial [Muribaculaceae bacterium]|nr:DegT/DnrJ/EryC1/StrS family aminotransferase [Muribaculaceae bacterium]
MADIKEQYPFLELGRLNARYSTELKEAAARVIDSGWYIGGPEVRAFEKELARYTGASCCIGVSNGLDAIRLIFRAYIELGRLRPGDEVIYPANTYIASILPIAELGLIPVAAPPATDDMNLDL